MRGYSEQIIFTSEQIADLELVTRIVKGLPEAQPDGEWVRCHELVRLLEPMLGKRWHVVDGRYGGCEHSWLIWRGRGLVVLDVYACGELPQVKLVDCNAMWRQTSYDPGPRRRDIRKNVIEWLKPLACAKVAS